MKNKTLMIKSFTSEYQIAIGNQPVTRSQTRFVVVNGDGDYISFTSSRDRSIVEFTDISDIKRWIDHNFKNYCTFKSFDESKLKDLKVVKSVY